MTTCRDITTLRWAHPQVKVAQRGVGGEGRFVGKHKSQSCYTFRNYRIVTKELTIMSMNSLHSLYYTLLFAYKTKIFRFSSQRPDTSDKCKTCFTKKKILG